MYVRPLSRPLPFNIQQEPQLSRVVDGQQRLTPLPLVLKAVHYRCGGLQAQLGNDVDGLPEEARGKLQCACEGVVGYTNQLYANSPTQRPCGGLVIVVLGERLSAWFQGAFLEQQHANLVKEMNVQSVLLHRGGRMKGYFMQAFKAALRFLESRGE